MITYLYVKTHNITGLKYFGKTTRNPNTYRGSGKYWLRHLRKHGNDVSTVIIGEYLNCDMLTEAAKEFSDANNIVDSKGWANLIMENGLDGAPPGNIVKAETRKKISNALMGRSLPKTMYKMNEPSSVRSTRARNDQLGRIWITDGYNDLKVKGTADIPAGWKRGRSKTENLKPPKSNTSGNNTRNKKIFNNGVVHKYFYPEEVPEGFVPGKMDGYQGGTGANKKGKHYGKEKTAAD